MNDAKLAVAVSPGHDDAVEVSVFLGKLTVADAQVVVDFMPQLVKDLKREWPVQGWRLQRRNPYRPEGTEAAIVLVLLSPLLGALGERLRDVVLEKVRILFSRPQHGTKLKIGKKPALKAAPPRQSRSRKNVGRKSLPSKGVGTTKRIGRK